jgi:hypothetical protein
MDVAHLFPHVKSIEDKIRENNLDTIVYGLGPSAWLLPWIDSSLLQSVQLWSAHDAQRILPADHLLLVDSPSHTKRLLVGTEAYETVVKSRPKKIWVNSWWSKEWNRHLHFSVKSITETVHFWVWTHQPKNRPQKVKPTQWAMGGEDPHCGFISPLASATLAWREGRRRIGVLGVDMGPEHGTHGMLQHVDHAFTTLAGSAHEQGGCCINLSPVTYLKHFPKWTPSESLLEPTAGSETAKPSES